MRLHFKKNNSKSVLLEVFTEESTFFEY